MSTCWRDYSLSRALSLSLILCAAFVWYGYNTIILFHFKFVQKYIPRGGEGHSLCWVVRYARLYMGCFWEISVGLLFPQHGYLFSTKFLYFFRKVGIYFEENFCVCRARWNPFARNFLYFIPQSWCNLHIKFLYISARWVSFQEIYCSGWNQLKTSGANYLKLSWFTFQEQLARFVYLTFHD